MVNVVASWCNAWLNVQARRGVKNAQLFGDYFDPGRIR